ncbi:MAG: response regulator [Burkholderiaceae bacterium]|nr:response regulator [Burkholderiaceae bacterium]
MTASAPVRILIVDDDQALRELLTSYLATSAFVVDAATDGLRAGHGPGIGGFKIDSEVGVALRDEFKRPKIETIQPAFENGSALDAWVRIMIRPQWDEKRIGERAFHFVRRMLAENRQPERMTLAQLKQVLKQQALLMLPDPDRAVRALPGLLPKKEQRREAIAAARKGLGTRGPLSNAQKARFAEPEELLAIAAKPARRRASDRLL